MTAPDPHRHAPVLNHGPAVEDASAVLICLHGRGATARHAIALGAEVAPPGAALLAPQAAGNTWYPMSFLAPIERNQPHLDSALERLGEIVRDLRHAGVPRSRTMLIGFSQGACLACEFVARNPDAASRAAVLTGGLIGHEIDEARYPASDEPATIHLTTGVPDQHVPEHRVTATARLLELRRHLVSLAMYPGRPHTVSMHELSSVRALFGTN